jgi:hypothetical protein
MLPVELPARGLHFIALPPLTKTQEPQFRKRTFIMSMPTQASEQSLRIDAEELRTRLESGEAVTMLDARGQKGWEASPDKIRGAVRVRAADLQIDPSWPRDRLTVVY